MELSIDTSTRYASVAISRRGECMEELTWRSERNHSVELVPAIRELLSRRGSDVGDIEAMFVAGGPGGFSALRVGMSTAKALAVGLGVPLVSVGTLEVEAQPYLGLGAPVRALIEAGRDRLYVGAYDDGPEPDYSVMSYDELVSSAPAAAVYCGEGASAARDALRALVGPSGTIASVPPPTRRAGVLAHLGFERWQAGATDDPATVEPLYLRSTQVDMAHRTWLRG